MELRSGSWGYRSEDASRESLIVLLCALVPSVNIHRDVHGEFFDHELSIFMEQVVGFRPTLTSVMDLVLDPHSDLLLLSVRLVVISRNFPVV